MASEKLSQVAIGFRVKTGRATAVVLAGPASAPRVVSRGSLQLFDPAIPESHQPYHAEIELPAAESARVVPRALDAVSATALSALRDLAREVRTAGHAIVAVSIVAGSDTDPESIRNPHMRAHAREGQLFPRALAEAAKRLGLASSTHVESDVFDTAAARLGKSTSALRAEVTELGRTVGAPWSAEEKAATAAAWIALVR